MRVNALVMRGGGAVSISSTGSGTVGSTVGGTGVVRGGTPTITLPPWDTRKTVARRTYKMLSNSAGDPSLAITKQLLTT